MALNIPELRERARNIAAETYSHVKALSSEELIGDPLTSSWVSRDFHLAITPRMVFERTGIARGHYLCPRNSLAVAVVNSGLALTKSAAVRYHKPVYLGQRVVAKAQVAEVEGVQYLIHVESKVDDELVFSGEYTVVDVESKESAAWSRSRLTP